MDFNIKLYLRHITKVRDKDEERRNCNYEMCKECEGHCCLSGGCEISPKDLDEVNVSTIKDLLNSGVVSIDAWEDMDTGRIFYLRMRHKDADIADFPIVPMECILHDSTGCRLEYTFRGKGARELIPYKEDGVRKCKHKYSKSMCKDEWNEYQDIIKQACKELGIELKEQLEPFDAFSQMLKAMGIGGLF